MRISTSNLINNADNQNITIQHNKNLLTKIYPMEEDSLSKYAKHVMWRIQFRPKIYSFTLAQETNETIWSLMKNIQRIC